MPIQINCEETASIEFEEFIQLLRESKFDTCDTESFLSVAPLLKKLYNNRGFLGDYIIKELKEHCEAQSQGNTYTAQVILLHNEVKDNFFIRANFWPSPQDSIFKASGHDPFFYYQPHNHNFNFMTVGYFGPGYWSDYYHVDYDKIEGYPGEKVDLKFIEHSRLEQGKMLLYEANKDVHDQLPSDAMSVSINIMESDTGANYIDQYRFDIENSSISKHFLSQMPLQAFLGFASLLGDENAFEIIESLGKSHLSQRVRVSALLSLVRRESDTRKQQTMIENYLSQDDSKFVQYWLKDYRKKISKQPIWEEKFNQMPQGS